MPAIVEYPTLVQHSENPLLVLDAENALMEAGNKKRTSANVY